MKVGEEELKARISAARERRKKIKDLTLAVIEGHLLIEEALDECIRTAVYHPEPLKSVRLMFYNKGMICASLCYKRERDEMWPVIWAVNQLRNTIAHNLDSEEIDEKVKYLRKCYIEALEPKPAAYAETQGDQQIVEDACGICVGFLAQLTSEAKLRRGLVDQHWKGP
jgi:hypothetical protein